MSAIKVGAPLHIAGQAATCEQIYLDCYDALLQPGDVQACGRVRKVLKRHLDKLVEGEPDHNAWELRFGFDSILTLAESPVESNRVRFQLAGESQVPAACHALFKCSTSASVSSFRSVNDVVVGGQSYSRVTYDGDTRAAVFSGHVLRTENSDGWASSRVQGQFPSCSHFSGFFIDCLAEDASLLVDFVTKDVDAAQSLVCFRATFQPPVGEFKRVLIPFSAFDEPERMGRPVIWPELNLSTISEVGFKVSTPHVGPFKLSIREVGVYRE